MRFVSVVCSYWDNPAPDDCWVSRYGTLAAGPGGKRERCIRKHATVGGYGQSEAFCGARGEEIEHI